MCPERGTELKMPQCSAACVELADLHKIAEHLRDLSSCLAKHGLEHEAAYVMMAFKRVYARLTRVVASGGSEPGWAA
jgi:hypothetical protein